MRNPVQQCKAASMRLGDSAQNTSSDSDVSQVLSDFLNLLQDSQSSTLSYGADGDSLISQIQSLIVNYQA